MFKVYGTNDGKDPYLYAEVDQLVEAKKSFAGLQFGGFNGGFVLEGKEVVYTESFVGAE